jgi:long-chain fatty acid transport protein
MFNRTLTVCLLVLLVAASAFATNGTKLIGFDARTVGRGGTSFGFFDNASVMMTNPAGMAFLGGSQIDANFSLMVPGLQFSNGVNGGATGKTNYFPLVDAGYVANPVGELTWGVGAFTQGGMGADFNLNHNLFRTQAGDYVQQEYHSKLAVMQGGVSAAYKLLPSLSVGASAHVVYSMLEFAMPYSLSPSVMKGVVNPSTGMTFGDMFAAPPSMGGFGYTEVTAAAKMTGLKAVGFAGKVGLAWTPNDKVSLGLSYSSSSALTYKSGKAAMDMTYQLNDAFGKAVMGVLAQNPGMTMEQAQQAVMTMFGNLGINMAAGVVANYDLEVKLTLPQSVGFGAMVKASDNFRVAFDFEWVNWKNAFDKMTLTMKNGSSTNINTMLGNNGNFSLEFPMNWDDAYCARVGVEFDASRDLTLRAGGAFGSNPVPAATIFPVFPAIVENHFTLGASYHVTDPLIIHCAYERAFPFSETGATPSTIAQEYSGSQSSLQENIYHLSFSWLLH